MRRRLARGRRRLGAWAAHVRRGTLRVTLGTRILLVLVAVVGTSTGISVWMQDSALSADLRRAGRERLQRAAELAGHLLDDRLEAQLQCYRMVASSPQFCANVEAGHGPTLAYFAEQLRPVHRAAAILFVDVEGREVAGAGDEGLRAAATAALPASSAGSAAAHSLFVVDGHPFAAVAVAVSCGGVARGGLLAVEALGAAELDEWSGLCRARVCLGPPAAGDPAMAAVPTRGPLQLHVEASFAEEAEALAHSRENLLVGGSAGLALALAASILLVRSLVRPIRTIQRAAERIGAGDFGLRLDEGRNDEVGDVARSFNLMLDRLQRNMRERARFANQASHVAFHDSLTGLPNRRLLKQQLSALLETSPQHRIAVIGLDLDRFQSLNDTLGHGAGDSLLLEVACRLHASLDEFAAPGAPVTARPVLARLGGDEFAIVLGLEGRDDAARLAGELLAALGRPCDVRGHDVTVAASIGIAVWPDDGADADALLRGADMAMCHAKGHGGGAFEFFADSMEQIAAKRFALENRLRRALDNDEFELLYQPKLDLASNRVVGVEALLRWHSADGESVPPSEFVPMAEATGAIVPIGEWVLRTAVAQCLAWREQGLPPLCVSVNVSPRQIARGEQLFAQLQELLLETGLEPHNLQLEITESSLVKDEDAAVALLERVRELGVGVSLDDFGTGYSSLSYLRRLPIDTLKIDRSFIDGADRDPADAALVGSIITMAKVLGLRVVVEGVETRGQRRFLEQLGCDEVQGYLIGRPMPASDIAALLSRQGRRSRASGERVRKAVRT